MRLSENIKAKLKKLAEYSNISDMKAVLCVSSPLQAKPRLLTHLLPRTVACLWDIPHQALKPTVSGKVLDLN